MAATPQKSHYLHPSHPENGYLGCEKRLCSQGSLREESLSFLGLGEEGTPHGKG